MWLTVPGEALQLQSKSRLLELPHLVCYLARETDNDLVVKLGLILLRQTHQTIGVLATHHKKRSGQTAKMALQLAITPIQTVLLS